MSSSVPHWYPGRAAGLALAWAFPAVPAVLGYSRCPVAMLFHCSCPGCGMTRALWSALAGDLGASLRFHPLALPVALAMLALAVTSVWVILRTGGLDELWTRRAGKWLLGSVVAIHGATIVLWALRLAGLFGGPVPV